MHVCTHARTHARIHFVCTTNYDKFRSNRFGVLHRQKFERNIDISHKYAYPITRILIAFHFNRTHNHLTKRSIDSSIIYTNTRTTQHMLCVQ